MDRIATGDEIIHGFIAFTAMADRALNDRFVTIGLRGGTYGYARIYGPNGDRTQQATPCIVVERYNGAVHFNHEGIAQRMEAEVRPAEPITRHPLGSSGGAPGNYGRVQWGLTPEVIQQRFGSVGEFVEAVVGAFEAAGQQW